MASLVNLDALIPREDFLSDEGPGVGESEKKSVTVTDLTKGESFYSSLRKPDFQRETASWSPEAVSEFIRTFISGDLIPAVICWQSPSRLSFVIDGAHRLSAVIAWLRDDYGDKDESIKFYDNQIPDEQRRIAKKTRDLIESMVGSYKDLRAELTNPGSNPKLSEHAKALAHAGIQLQWIRSSDSQKAERAFFTINQSAVAIDPTELKILNARFTSTAIASRAIVRNATGHKYWKGFSDAARKEIEDTGKRIYKSFYNPPLEQPVKSGELPVAGHGYGSQTLPLIFDFVNIANAKPVIDASKKKSEAPKAEHEKPNEDETLEVMRKADRLARRMTGTHASSLGLHPAVYFYSLIARHQPTPVLAMASLMMDMEATDSFIPFTHVRKNFEDFLVSHKFYVNQLTARFGSMAKGFRQMKECFAFVLEQCKQNRGSIEIETALSQHERFHILVVEKAVETTQAKEFSKAVKQFVVLREVLERASICTACGARIDSKSMQIDHKDEKSKGGLGTASNAQMMHPFCNSTYKRWLEDHGQDKK